MEDNRKPFQVFYDQLVNFENDVRKGRPGKVNITQEQATQFLLILKENGEGYNTSRKFTKKLISGLCKKIAEEKKYELGLRCMAEKYIICD